MSTDHIEGHRDGEVVPLRARDAGTEIRTSEAAGPRTPTCRTAGFSARRSSPRTGAPGGRRGSM
jgi:hypothetical protein